MIGKNALISPCGCYRYWLERCWDRSKSQVVFIMLNPSTADASVDDPTIRRCIGFAQSWGMGSLRVVNLFAWRATDPKNLRAAHAAGRDIVGPENDQHLLRIVHDSRLVVAGWGAQGSLLDRYRTVAKLLEEIETPLHALALTKTGKHPRHPLYLASHLKPRLWKLS